MKLSIIIIIVLSLSFIGCSDGKINSGEIEYEISYPYNKLSKLMEMMLPKKMTIIFKGDKMMTTIKKGNLFTTSIISNETTRELEMRLKMGSDIYNTHLNTDDIKDLLASQPKYTFSKSENGDSIVNCLSKHYEVNCETDSDTIGSFKSVFTDDFSVKNASWFSSYSKIEGMPLNYLIDRYGLIMEVKAVNFIKRDVDDSEFEPKNKYKEVSYKKYDKKVQDLFDIMLD